MTMSENVTRVINMSYAELIVVSGSIQTFMVRDTAEFANYGILTAAINAFSTKIAAFAALPTDLEFQVTLMDATALKNLIAGELRVMLRGFSERARLCFGIDEPKYQLFHSKELSHLSDSDLLLFSRMVKRSADTYATELLAFGLTAQMITDLNTKNNDFEDALEAQRFAIAERDAATTDRGEKAMELYNLLISYCETGKVIWNGVNQAYYNDYVVFGPNGALLTLIPPIDFTYNDVEHKFTWSALSNASSYEIEMSENSVDWTVLWTGTAHEYSYIPSAGLSIEYRCRGRNSSGYGPYCEPITIIFVEPLPAPATVTLAADYTMLPSVYVDVSWDVVAGATFYKVFECWVPFGAPEGVFASIGNFNLANVRRLVTRNRRYYYKVKAANDSTESADSPTMYIDIPA
jgi:hypothetical protein